MTDPIGAPPPSPLVLVVEDEDNIAAALAYVITRAGYGYERIATGASALDEIRGRRPRVVLLDIMLPDVSGYDICANVRKDHSLEAVKIIMMTARGSSHQRSKCIGLGANAFIEKPFDLTALRQELKRQIEPA